MNRLAVPRLHLISDSRICPLADFPALALKAVEGGVDAIHLREKNVDAICLLDAAHALRGALSNRARLIVNDRVDVALIAGADGVQLGERSLSLLEVRKLVGDRLLLGRSVHDVDVARWAETAGADFVVAGHVYDTASKAGQPGRGPAFIESVASAISIPVIAIGGITPETAPEVMNAGAYGVAVMSAILRAKDPEATARQFREAMRQHE